MRNLTLHLDEHATLRIRRLHGEVVPTTPGAPSVLDDPLSFTIQVTSGAAGLTGDDLGMLLNGLVFAYAGAPLKRLHVRTEGAQLVLTGVLHKGVDLRFEITASIQLTQAGLVQLHPVRTRILGVDGEKLLHALGLHLDNLLDLRGSRGASVKGDDIFLDPTKILPPPAVAGRMTSARVDGNEVVLEYARTAADSVFASYVRSDSTVPNFVHFRGSRLRFGRLLMFDTDLLIVDADPSDPFDLNLAEYFRQLVAGTSHTLANGGLRVVMPDYHTLPPAHAR